MTIPSNAASVAIPSGWPTFDNGQGSKSALFIRPPSVFGLFVDLVEQNSNGWFVVISWQIVNAASDPAQALADVFNYSAVGGRTDWSSVDAKDALASIGTAGAVAATKKWFTDKLLPELTQMIQQAYPTASAPTTASSLFDLIMVYLQGVVVTRDAANKLNASHPS